MLWLLLLPIVMELVAVGVMAGLLMTLWKWQKNLKKTKGNIRGLAQSRHLQLRAFSDGILKVVEFSLITLVPRQFRLPMMLGREVFKRIK